VKGLLSGGVLEALRRAGPYILVELLLPGGTLLALLMWFFSDASRGHFAVARQPGMNPTTIERVVAVPEPALG
jgi:hypothetical protein